MPEAFLSDFDVLLRFNATGLDPGVRDLLAGSVPDLTKLHGEIDELPKQLEPGRPA
jgi:hypothetical protein